ncbi:MAG: tyrosine-type recombinase/integrase [Xanthobacteraceae bacterium]
MLDQSRAKGRVVTDWLASEDAFAITTAAEHNDTELALLLRFLLYTGVRLGEALKLDREAVRLEEATAWIRRGKGGIASDVRLTPELVPGFKAHLDKHERRRVFRFNQGGHLKHQLVRVKLAALKLPLPCPPPQRPGGTAQRLAWVNFHSFRHSWAS